MNKSERITISSDAPGARLFVLGNEAIARGAIEAGVKMASAYPGTPSTEIVETLINLKDNLDMQVEWSVNEKVAFGVAFGASLCGFRSMAVMKHVGLNVALDSVMTASYIGIPGGLVIVEAEDPGQWSSQDEQDNRYIAEEAYLPVLEPSSAAEAIEMVKEAFRLSEEFGQPFVIRSATRIGHSRSDITLGPINRTRPGKFPELDPDKLVMLPAVARKHRGLVIERMAAIKRAVNSWPFNRLSVNPHAELGVISSGISFSYLREALAWLKLEQRVSLLKIGTPYPAPEELIKQLLKSTPRILVVEELEPYLETRVKAIAQENRFDVIVRGKDLLPLAGEYSVRIITEALCRLFDLETPIDFNRIDALARETAPLLPNRPPALCAGCPHRASHFVIKSVCEKIKKETGIEPIRPGDIGCVSLGVHPPLNDVDLSTCMGGGFDLSCGIARVTDRPVIAHLGDSTFFHSGMAPMVNAVYNGTRITMIVLDNMTTAMTGSQPSPSSGRDSAGNAVSPIRPEDIARACGIKFVAAVDPLDIETAAKTLEQAVKFDGPSFLVFRHPCAIMDQREKRARGEKTAPCEIDREKCLSKADPFCTAACPLHIDVRGYVKLIKEGRYDKALKLIKEKLPFAGIMGRICTRPCESKCKRGEVDLPVAIAALKRFAADFGRADDGDMAVGPERTEKVAVVGGGPAGCMAAFDLRKAGYNVTLFESQSALGGMLSTGIPHYRLPRDIVLEELGTISRMGVEVRLNTHVGTDIRLEQLKEQYRAVFLAVGAHRGKKLEIENGDLAGVTDGISFLKAVNSGEKVEVKDSVAVIGGGNVAVDCARSCLRLGFREVKIIYRRERRHMPAIPEEINEAEKEGVQFHFLAVPARVLANEGRIKGVECRRIQLGKPDESGREAPVALEEGDFETRADMVIEAVGEEPDLDFLEGFPLDSDNKLIKADPVTLATGIPGIFAGGDAVSGPASAVEALAAGRKAAVSIRRYLNGEPLEASREGEGPRESPLQVETEGVSHLERVLMPKVAVGLRKNNSNEVETGYSPEEARREAERCLECTCNKCIDLLGCPAISIIDGAVSIDSAQCPGCGLCAAVCPAKAITSK
ncbi:MAG: indolepyruvate ferredoxin oxidoreductase subunit alpha [Dehalococcoidales bacterium]|nr:indolepyruvate ferredoxin oxidoreductase subunit alpha [Dehalococcoidales bacterium]